MTIPYVQHDALTKLMFHFFIESVATWGAVQVDAIQRRLLVSIHPSPDSEAHIDNTANTISTLDIADWFITGCSATSVNTYVHVLETIVDGRKGALVSNVFIDLDLAVQVIWANGLWGPQGRV